MEVSGLARRRKVVPLLAQRVLLDVVVLCVLRHLFIKPRSSLIQRVLTCLSTIFNQCLPTPLRPRLTNPHRRFLSAAKEGDLETAEEKLEGQFRLQITPSASSNDLHQLAASGDSGSRNGSRRPSVTLSPTSVPADKLSTDRRQSVPLSPTASPADKLPLGHASPCMEEESDKSLQIGGFGCLKEARWGDHKLVLVLVGLPARGKSYMSRHLRRYLSFEGFSARVFNAGDYRRRTIGAGQSAGFFDPENESGAKVRQQCASNCLEDLLTWLATADDSHVGIFDATNTTRERREDVLRRCGQIPGIRVAFLESICTNDEVLQKNYAMKLKNSDYVGWDEETARKDFLRRASQYEQLYETLDESEDDGKVSFMKILNCGEKMVQRRCEGFLVSKIASYMLNLHIEPRVIYICRHGLSEDNAHGRLGGDAPLTREGMVFAKRLRDFIREQLGWGPGGSRSSGSSASKRATNATLAPDEGWILFTSQLRRSRMTARPLLADKVFVSQSGMRRVHTALLNEINAGIYEGYTPKEIDQKAPGESRARAEDKLRYRYPKGESYLDVVQRVRPVVMEMERERRPVVAIVHQAVARTLLAFFRGVPLEEMPEIDIPIHTVIQLKIFPHGCETQFVHLGGKKGMNSDLSEDEHSSSSPGSSLKQSMGA